ncbi:copia protein [Tanacetum coccineum]
MSSKPKTTQDAIEFSTELMDTIISTLAERVAIAYAAGPGERKEYARTLPLCNKCKFHHNGQCSVKCINCKRVGHFTRDCRSPAATNNKRNPTCYEFRNQRNYKSDCPELKNENHGNQAGGTGACGMVHALGGETNQDLNNMEDDNNA